MTRYELHTGDALDVLRGMPDRSVDHVITDPPYLLNFGNCMKAAPKRGTAGPRAMGYKPFTADNARAVAPEIARVCARWMLVFSDVESTTLWRESLIGAGFRYVRTGAWVRTNPTPQFTGDRPGTGFEAATICHRIGPRMRWHGGGRAALWSHAQRHGITGDAANEHPTPKPLDLMLELVSLFTDPGETILDPFAGSGTTGVAALRLGRSFIGVEKDAVYAQLARDRLAAEEDGSTLQAARAGQTSLFGASR